MHISYIAHRERERDVTVSDSPKRQQFYFSSFESSSACTKPFPQLRPEHAGTVDPWLRNLVVHTGGQCLTRALPLRVQCLLLDFIGLPVSSNCNTSAHKITTLGRLLALLVWFVCPLISCCMDAATAPWCASGCAARALSLLRLS